MSLTGVFARFAIFYVLAVIIIGFVLNYFNSEEMSGINIAILLGLIIFIDELFAKKIAVIIPIQSKPKLF
jgi:uncharacterized membrane protein